MTGKHLIYQSTSVEDRSASGARHVHGMSDHKRARGHAGTKGGGAEDAQQEQGASTQEPSSLLKQTMSVLGDVLAERLLGSDAPPVQSGILPMSKGSAKEDSKTANGTLKRPRQEDSAGQHQVLARRLFSVGQALIDQDVGRSVAGDARHVGSSEDSVRKQYQELQAQGSGSWVLFAKDLDGTERWYGSHNVNSNAITRHAEDLQRALKGVWAPTATLGVSSTGSAAGGASSRDHALQHKDAWGMDQQLSLSAVPACALVTTFLFEELGPLIESGLQPVEQSEGGMKRPKKLDKQDGDIDFILAGLLSASPPSPLLC